MALVDIRDFADRLMDLTLAQAAELRVCLEEVHGIRATVGLVSVQKKPDAPAPPEPTHFSVVLHGVAEADKKIAVFKAIREITHLGLKETRELVESAPALVRTNLAADEAADLKKKLESAGARITLMPA